MHFKYAPGALCIQICSWNILNLEYYPRLFMLLEQLFLEHNFGPKSHKSIPFLEYDTFLSTGHFLKLLAVKLITNLVSKIPTAHCCSSAGHLSLAVSNKMKLTESPYNYNSPSTFHKAKIQVRYIFSKKLYKLYTLWNSILNVVDLRAFLKKKKNNNFLFWVWSHI